MTRQPLLIGLLFTMGMTAACERRTQPAAQPNNNLAQDRYRQPAKLVAALGLKPGDIVAEVGAGGGYLILRLAAAVGPSGRVVATDIDREALEALRARTAQLPQVMVRQAIVEQPGLEAGTYDLILLAQVDHLLRDRAAYLRLLRPALKPGGRIAVSNGERFLPPLAMAATAAGLRVEPIAVDLPGQFLVFLR